MIRMRQNVKHLERRPGKKWVLTEHNKKETGARLWDCGVLPALGSSIVRAGGAAQRHSGFLG